MARKVDGITPRLIDRHMRVVLTREAYEALGVRQGDHVAFVVCGGEVTLRKVRLALE